MALIEKYLAPGETKWSHIADRVGGVMQYADERAEVRDAIAAKLFLPNSPALVFGGRPGGRNMMACHAIHVGDSLAEILDAAKYAGMVFKSGGGVGFEFSAVSPSGTPLSYAREGGVASGPTSFMAIYDALANVILEGGLRRAAMMATLNASHPDIMDFVHCKLQDGVLENFNISVTVDDGPGAVDPDVWAAICKNAWQNGEPGIVYLDLINRNNALAEELGRIIAVNACAEQPLYDWGSCCMAHAVLPNVVKSPGDYTELRRIVRLAVRFLNRVIDVNHYPLPQFAQRARDVRNIGLGVMGLWDLLRAHGIPYASKDALLLADEIGEVVYTEADAESLKLGNEYGGYRPGKRRNSTLTTIAPTGHTSRLAGVENSIYAPYAIGLGLTVEQHLDHIAVWQRWIDSAISYTLSFPNDAPVGIVDRIYRGAYERGIKVICVYRDGSRAGQPCTASGECGL